MILVLYCLAIVLFSLMGGYLPLSRRLTHLPLQVYLSLSAGAMLGAAFFHMLPESAELAPDQFGLWMAMGVIGLYMIERFLSPHSHDTADLERAGKGGSGDANCHPGCGHGHRDAHGHAHAAPKIAGWSAVAGLSVHTILGGMALGSAVLAQGAAEGLGLAVFLATVLHKPADALTISTLLVKAGTSRYRAWGVQFFFALLIPLGVLLFYASQYFWKGQLDSEFTGCVLAFSAGTFLCIAMADLLPEVQFHSHDRVRLFLAVLAGMGLMAATSLFEPGHAHGHDHDHESAAPAGAPAAEITTGS